MLGAIRALFIPKPPEAVHATYIALVAAARNPFFYTRLAVPDTIDGRFDLIVLHLFLLQDRLQHDAPQNPDAADFSQYLGEAFIADLDANLREMGVADTGVSKRMKAMGKAYHGRLQAYAASKEDDTQLRAALARNLYGTVAQGDVASLATMAAYVRHAIAALAAIPTVEILAGNTRWPQPITF